MPFNIDSVPRPLRPLMIIPAMVWLCVLALGSPPARAGMKSPGAYFDESAAALVKAAVDGDAARAAELVKAGADPNAEGRGNQASLRPLHYAIAVNSERGVRILLRLGADPLLPTKLNARPLLFPIYQSKPGMLAVLLEEVPRDRIDRETAAKMVEDAVDVEGGETALKMLLDRGFPPELPEDEGLTPLLDAVMSPVPSFEMVEMLVRAGAAINPEPGLSGLNPANAVQFMLNEQFRVGTKSHNTVLRMKALFEEFGVKYPVPTPKEVRLSRGEKR